MPTDAELAQITAKRKKDLIAAEIEARRKAAMGLLAGFDPDSPVATQSVMGPDPTFSGVPGQSGFLRGAPSQVTPGDTETILDRRRKPDLWSQVPDMRTEEFDPSDMQPIPRSEPFNPADMLPMRIPPPMRGRERTTPVYLPEYDQLRKAKAIAAEREKILSQTGTALNEADALVAKKGSLTEQIAALQDPGTPLDTAGTAAPTALVPRAEPTQQQPTRPYWDSIESIYGPNVRARVGDARADEMEMNRFGPAVTPGAVTRAPTTQREPSISNIASQITRKKNILRAVSSVWGTKDNSKSYETSALLKMQDQIDQGALRSIANQDWVSEPDLLKALIRAGASAKLIGQVSNWDMVVKPGEKVWLHDPSGEETPKHVSLDSSPGIQLIEKGWMPKSELPEEKAKPDSTLLTSKLFTPASKKLYAESGDVTDLEYVTVTGEPKLGGYKDLKQVRDVESIFRKEYIGQAKDFSKVVDAYGRILAAVDVDSGPGDLALIFNYMKMLDPNSVVRESEFATAENAGGVSAYVRNAYNRVLRGTRFKPEVRAQFIEASDALFREKDATQQGLIKQYEGLATRAEVDPTNVILRYAPRIIEDGIEYIMIGTHKIRVDLLTADGNVLEM